MLNELQSFRQGLEECGMTLREVQAAEGRFRYHRSLPSTSKGVTLLLLLEENNTRLSVLPPEFVRQLRYVKRGTFYAALTFKFNYEPGKRSNLSQGIRRHIGFHEEISDNVARFHDDRLVPFPTLVQRLRSLDVEKLIDDVLAFMQANELTGMPYLTVDVADSGPRIQCESFFQGLSDAFFRIDAEKESTELDAFGKPAVGIEKPFDRVKTSVGEIPAITRNSQNGFNARYGLNSADAFPIGLESRDDIVDTLNFIFRPEMKVTDEQPGIWYRYKWSRSSGAGVTDLRDEYILTSLCPFQNNHLIEGNVEDVFENLQERIMEMADALHLQHKKQPTLTGKTVILQVCGKGAWHVKANLSHSFETIAERINEWCKGIANGPSRGPRGIALPHLTIYGLVTEMNRRWMFGDDAFYFDKTIHFEMEDGYRLFYGDDPYVLDKFCRRFARDHVALQLRADTIVGYLPKQFGALARIRNLLLYQKGYLYRQTGAHGMETQWAFTMGKLFRISNVIYRKFFELRGSSVPNLLVGQRFSQAALSNPRQAMAQFIRAMLPAIHWAENYKGSVPLVGSYIHYVRALSNTEIPEKCTAADVLLIHAGYYDSLAKEDASEAPAATEEQPSITK